MLAVRRRRLKRLETKKAGEASLWLATVQSGATCNETTDKPSCIKTVQSEKPARKAAKVGSERE
jgi:hypothetical protein